MVERSSPLQSGSECPCVAQLAVTPTHPAEKHHHHDNQHLVVSRTTIPQHEMRWCSKSLTTQLQFQTNWAFLRVWDTSRTCILTKFTYARYSFSLETDAYFFQSNIEFSSYAFNIQSAIKWTTQSMTKSFLEFG